MSVEQSSPSVSHKAVAATEGRGGVGKAKSGANSGAGDAAPGGFMALLAAFDEPESLTSLPSDVATDLPGGLVVPTTAPDKAEAVEVPWSELSMLLGQKMPLDTLVPDAQVMVGEQVLTDSQIPAGVAALIKSGEPALFGTATALVASNLSAANPLTMPDPKGVDLSKIDTAVAKTTAQIPVPDITNQGLPAPGRKTSSTQLLPAVSSAVEVQVLKPTTFMDLLAKEPALSGALLSSGLGTDVLNQATKGVSKPISGVTPTGLEGSFAQHALTPSNSAAVASAPTGATMSPESAVAEQVTFWVSQGIQNAQLKLDGFGAEAVEVTISVNGQEAQIDFRTDQPEVRQMLEGALTQLKETLAREGLVLSGVSVGTSGQEGAGGQNRRQRPNSQQATVVVPEVTQAVGLQRASTVAGRALDVFV